MPDSVDEVLGRQLLTADGQIAGVTGPNDCSGGNLDNQKTGKVFNRWALTLSHFDWATHQFTFGKVLLDTSIDPATEQSRAIITGGPMKGGVIRSSYDPDVVRFRGEDWVVFECTLEDGKPFGVEGTSSCISVYDPVHQVLDLSRTQVIISGEQVSGTILFNASAVPELLAYHDRLYIYWSTVAIIEGRFAGISVRGAELSIKNGTVSVKRAKRGTAPKHAKAKRAEVKFAQGRVVHSLDDATTEVWGPDPADPTRDTTVDLRGLWVTTNGSIMAAASIGGRGCTAPSNRVKGCFRLALAESKKPLGKDVFGHGRRVTADWLPSNPQEYTRPIRDPDGAYWFIGHYIKPLADGVSDIRPMPNAKFWLHYQGDSALIMFPIPEKSLWPVGPGPRER